MSGGSRAHAPCALVSPLRGSQSFSGLPSSDALGYLMPTLRGSRLLGHRTLLRALSLMGSWYSETLKP